MGPYGVEGENVRRALLIPAEKRQRRGKEEKSLLKFYHALQKSNKWISFLERYALFLICTISICSMFIQTIFRYCFKISTPWAEEVCIYTFQWIAWIGGAYAVYSGDHLRINIMDSFLDKVKNPKFAHILMDIFSMTVVLVCCGIFLSAYSGYWAKVSVNPQMSAATRWPLTIVQVSLLIGSVLMLVQGSIRWLELICEAIIEKRKGEK